MVNWEISMDPRQLPQFGEPQTVEEILADDVLEGKSVRVTGKLTNYDCQRSVAILKDPRSGKTVSVVTRLVEPFNACVGELVQFIGETEFNGEFHDVIVKARVVRSVNSIDLQTYHSALEKQRVYLANR